MACAADRARSDRRGRPSGRCTARGGDVARAHAPAAAAPRAADRFAAHRGGEPGRLRISDRGVELELAARRSSTASQARCPHGRRQVWTRKQAGSRAHGTLALDGGARAGCRGARRDRRHGRLPRSASPSGAGAPASARRRTARRWRGTSSAGVNDPPHGSERAVWVEGAPHETAPVELRGRSRARSDCRDGSQLRFAAEAERAAARTC